MAVTWKAKSIVISLLSVALASCSKTPNPIPAGADTFYYGNLLEGQKFGLVIGQAEADARKAMAAHGYRYVGEFECSYTTRLLLGCNPSDRFAEFDHQQFGRTGHIYLKIKAGHVSQIGWAFSSLPYIDT